MWWEQILPVRGNAAASWSPVFPPLKIGPQRNLPLAVTASSPQQRISEPSIRNVSIQDIDLLETSSSQNANTPLTIIWAGLVAVDVVLCAVAAVLWVRYWQHSRGQSQATSGQRTSNDAFGSHNDDVSVRLSIHCVDSHCLNSPHSV